MFTYIHDDEVKTIKTYTKNKQNSSTRRTAVVLDWNTCLSGVDMNMCGLYVSYLCIL